MLYFLAFSSVFLFVLLSSFFYSLFLVFPFQVCSTLCNCNALMYQILSFCLQFRFKTPIFFLNFLLSSFISFTHSICIGEVLTLVSLFFLNFFYLILDVSMCTSMPSLLYMSIFFFLPWKGKKKKQIS